MTENRLFEALLDVIPFCAYAVDVNSFEVVYANKMMKERMYNEESSYCWEKLFGQKEVCSWCNISQLKLRKAKYENEKLVTSFFDESTDKWLQTYDELIKWPDGRVVKYSIAVDITEQKEIQSSLIQAHTKLAVQTKKLQSAYENLELLVKKDYLTKVNTRGEYFKQSIEMFDENNTNLYVAMLDIDNFKQLNDTFGHKIGDEALIMFCDAIMQMIDSDDVFGRLGGEEFALTFVRENDDDALKLVNGIKEVISKIVINKDEQNITFTVSIGLVRNEDRLKSIDKLLEIADKRLYCAKNDGRNKVKFRI